MAQHRQGTASRHHFLFDLPRYQVARFHSQEVDTRLEPHPVETDEKREGETPRERLIWSSDEHMKNKKKEAKWSQWELGRLCLKWNLPHSQFPCPDFLADFL